VSLFLIVWQGSQDHVVVDSGSDDIRQQESVVIAAEGT